MPRSVRLDEEGALHHVILRGIERRRIFLCDHDRLEFLRRLEVVLTTTGSTALAWALIPNHAHLFLRSGRSGLPSVMRRLLTGYATFFNRKYKRVGHLLQNRYQSTLVDSDHYFLNVLAYIHLNPIRHHLIENLMQLKDFPWTGHRTLLGLEHYPWMNPRDALSLLSPDPFAARSRYLIFLQETLTKATVEDLEGGGLARSVGGWTALEEIKRGREKWCSDERILGSSDFVENLLIRLGKAPSYEPSILQVLAERLIPQWSSAAGIGLSELLNSSRTRKATLLRRRIAYLAIRHLGLGPAQTARLLQCSISSVGRAIDKYTERVDEECLSWFRSAILDCQLVAESVPLPRQHS